MELCFIVTALIYFRLLQKGFRDPIAFANANTDLGVLLGVKFNFDVAAALDSGHDGDLDGRRADVDTEGEVLSDVWLRHLCTYSRFTN